MEGVKRRLYEMGEPTGVGAVGSVALLPDLNPLVLERRLLRGVRSASGQRTSAAISGVKPDDQREGEITFDADD